MRGRELVTKMNTRIGVVAVSALLIGIYATPASAQYGSYGSYASPYSGYEYTNPYTVPTVPGAGSTYDSNSGNLYNWSRDYSGNTTVYGNNARTGSTWNQTIDRYGSMRGMDSDYNLWSYDKQSGVYLNSNGTVCFGSGRNRTCD